MSYAERRKIGRLEGDLMAKDADVQRTRDRHHADLFKANDAALEAQNKVVELEAELEDAQSERDSVQTENEELRQTMSREREDWRRERGTLEFRASEAESQLHAARSGHASLGG